jgi:hypothetical protein
VANRLGAALGQELPSLLAFNNPTVGKAVQDELRSTRGNRACIQRIEGRM